MTALLSIHVLKFSPIFKSAHLHVPDAEQCTLGTGCSKTDHKKKHFWGIRVSLRGIKWSRNSKIIEIPVNRRLLV